MGSIPLVVSFSTGCKTPTGSPPPCPAITPEALIELQLACGPELEACPGTEAYLQAILRHCRAVEALR